MFAVQKFQVWKEIIQSGTPGGERGPRTDQPLYYRADQPKVCGTEGGTGGHAGEGIWGQFWRFV